MDFDTCITKVWGLCIYFVKKVTSTCGSSTSLEPTGSLRACLNWPNLTTFLWHRSWSATGEGGRWLVSPSWTPPPTLGNSFFCLILLNYMTSGVFSRCKLSLLKQHILLILMQPSWDDYLLLYSTKSSIHGTTIHIKAFVQLNNWMSYNIKWF